VDEDGRQRLEAAYREDGGDLWRAILAFSGGIQEVADEAVAEAFAQAGRRLGEIRSLRPWLYRAAFRIAAGELGRRRQAGLIGDIPAHQINDDDGIGDLLELARILTPTQRAAFVLRVVFGYSSKEAAALMGVSEVAVRVHLHSARRRLRHLLAQEVIR
jgi:RNA polymerase sigma-70 factor, ECF subfamily